MAFIGVDSSGKVDSLPMYMVAVRGNQQRICRVKFVPKKFKNKKNWKIITTACYIFKVLKPLYRKGEDTILIDRDFHSKGMQKICKYLEILMKNYYHIKEIPIYSATDSEKPVQAADIISRMARKRRVQLSFFDANINKEYELITQNS